MICNTALQMSTVSWVVLALVSSQGAPCDAGLRTPAQNPYAYGPRGDRCEGVYVKQVGGTVLAVASLTSSFERYDPASVKDLRFTWSAPADSGLRIRVRGIQPNLYYGMDAVRPGGARSFEWPTAILSSLRIAQPDIGALAWTRRRVGGGWRNVYLPLRISGAGAAASGQGYALVLFPGVKLQEVYVTLGPADATGRAAAGKLVMDHEAQEQGFYPAERPIRIKLPPLDPPGLYYLEVSATLPGGSPVAVEPVLIDTSAP
jgi:hypothetical protein